MDTTYTPTEQPQATSPAHQTPQTVAEVKDRAKEQLSAQLESGKERAAGELEGLAEVLRATGHQLKETQRGAIGAYAERLAEGVERVSGYLHDQSLAALKRDTEDLARRQPALFVGAAFALGLLAARFFRSSPTAQPSTTAWDSRSYEPGSGLDTPGTRAWSEQAPQPGMDLWGGR